MAANEITVVYRWTAKPGKLAELKAIYEQVREEMEANEPGALKMECYFADDAGEVIVHDVFADGKALGFHLGVTAAQHFPKLTEIAVPGPFFFCGDVPTDLRQAAEGMNMGAVFGTHAFGFSRS
ncbi:MAG: antibiotic biosynthesis monooxygenase [Gemmatimonadota bacterium]|nr:antibiotic biosynthesis monooxygenase [Gemmatimonadota bacterium]